MTFADLVPGMRTYVAAMNVQPQFAPATAALTRPLRKVLAWTAMHDAELEVRSSLEPKLEQLHAAGLVSSYEFAPGTGSLIINVPNERAGVAWQALRGVHELGRIHRNHAIRVDDPLQGPQLTVRLVAPATPRAVEVGWNVDKLGVRDVWTNGVTGTNVTVGLCDSGANVEHPALRSRFRGTRSDGTITSDYSFFDPVYGKTAPYDDISHGSHVAGTAVGGDSNHLIGMAPGATFVSAKIFDRNGSGSTATVLKALSWMLAPTRADGTGADPRLAPDVLSNSWGDTDGANADFVEAWAAIEAAGIVNIVAAGNSGPRGGTINSPGSYPESITVAATDKNDHVAGFSSRGPDGRPDPSGAANRKPDVAAPGVAILSAGAYRDNYVTMSGTSMATPAVAGVAALILSRYPSLTPRQVREALVSTALDIDQPGWDKAAGAGRVDAAAALRRADALVDRARSAGMGAALSS